jgi:membrane fusion protein (multidrug efflux system)
MRAPGTVFFLVLVATLLTACGGGEGDAKKGKGPGGPGAGMPPPEVTVAPVEPRPVALTFEYTGQTAGSRVIEVRARVGGILLKRNFTEGEAVKQGQSLYQIDPAPFEAALARAEADLAAAQAREQQAQRNAARLKPLIAEKAVSQTEHDDAVSAEAIAAADVKAARARVTEAKLNLGYTRVEAPAAGLASRSERSEGSFIAGPETLLTTVIQADPIWVNFGIPDLEQARIQKDAEAGRLQLPKNGSFEVELRLSDGSTFPRKGKLNFADVRISPQTGTREARAEVPNPEGRLRPGQFVRVILRGATVPNAVSVPQRAVLESPQGGKFVYVVDEKGTAQPRPIEAGDWIADRWLVTSGLKAGEKVIVDGVMKIGPGAPVRIAQPQQPPAEKQAKK